MMGGIAGFLMERIGWGWPSIWISPIPDEWLVVKREHLRFLLSRAVRLLHLLDAAADQQGPDGSDPTRQTEAEPSAARF